MVLVPRSLLQGGHFAAILLAVSLSGPCYARGHTTPAAGLAAHHAQAASADAGKIVEARKALDDNLLDYRSTRLRNVQLVATSAKFEAFCGEINTTNRMGGYSGWNQFIIPLGDTPMGNILDKVTIAGQPNAMQAFMGQYGDGGGGHGDGNARLIALYCGGGKREDAVDYATTLSFRQAQ